MLTENNTDLSALLKDIYKATFDYAILSFDLWGNVKTWNIGAERITGFSQKEMIGQNIKVMFTPEDVEVQEVHQEMATAKATGRAENDRWHLRKDGSRFCAEGVLTPSHNVDGQHNGYLKIFRDITDDKIAQSENQRVANTDLLTGLASRHAFDIHAIEILSRSIKNGQAMALHLIDLNRFKQVNDSFGHHAGDALLQQTAKRLMQVVGDDDFVARLGGDEFVILQPDLSSVQLGAELAGKIVHALSQPFGINGHQVQISGSVGIVVCPDDAEDLDQLLKKAHLALSRAKKDGDARYHYFTEKLDAIAQHASFELAEVRRAVEKKEFSLEYQPRIACATGRTHALEALLRCSTPAFAGYSVERVIDLALEAGLMKNLSIWILREACMQLRKWKDSGMPPLKMCVNLSSEDLIDTRIPEIIDAILAETELKGTDLEIEITERQALDIEKHGVDILNALRSRGISVDIDDFGTGYSALSYLRNLPVTAVKLDKSFLIGVPHEEQGCAVIKAVVELSRALELEVVAEGVETEEQAKFLMQNNCTTLQGFYFTKPLSADGITTWLLGEHEAVYEARRALL